MDIAAGERAKRSAAYFTEPISAIATNVLSTSILRRIVFEIRVFPTFKIKHFLIYMYGKLACRNIVDCDTFFMTQFFSVDLLIKRQDRFQY